MDLNSHGDKNLASRLIHIKDDCKSVRKRELKQKDNIPVRAKEREIVPVFLAEPCTPAPTAPLPGLPGAPVFLLNRLLKKLASTPSLAAPASGYTQKTKSL